MPAEFPILRYIKNRHAHRLRHVNKVNKRRLTYEQRGDDNDYQYYTNRKICATLRFRRYDRNTKRFVEMVKRVTVPKLFLTDGCTGPCNESVNELDWIIHDWLFSVHKTDDGTPITYTEANSIFKIVHRRLVAQLFGKFSWDWSGERGPQFYNASELELEEMRRPISKQCALFQQQKGKIK